MPIQRSFQDLFKTVGPAMTGEIVPAGLTGDEEVCAPPPRHRPIPDRCGS